MTGVQTCALPISGSGKGTIVEQLKAKDDFALSISATTRAPRAVSYTHLDVYKRQGQFHVVLIGQAAAVDHDGGVAAGDAGLDALQRLSLIHILLSFNIIVTSLLGLSGS